MDARDVLDVLTVLDEELVEVVIEGGWGVDALAGAQHRDHDDLDLVVWERQLGRVLSALGNVGFAADSDADTAASPHRVPLVDRVGRRVDLTVVSTDERGDHWAGPRPSEGAPADESSIRYPASSFTTGWVAGRQVRCIDPLLQVAKHDRYTPAPRDHQDMAVLRESFGVTLPAQYH